MYRFRQNLFVRLERTREELTLRATEIVCSSDASVPRVDVEQHMRACVAILTEAASGHSRAVREAFLEALPYVARETTWGTTIEKGLQSWAVIVGLLGAETEPEHRDLTLAWLARLTGAWWADVSAAMLPVMLRRGTL